MFSEHLYLGGAHNALTFLWMPWLLSENLKKNPTLTLNLTSLFGLEKMASLAPRAAVLCFLIIRSLLTML